MGAWTSKKAQSAFEYLTTYGWAFLIIAIMIGGLVLFVYLPANAIPARCSFIYAITCQGISVNTNSIATAVNIYLVNAQQYDLSGSPIATVNISAYGTANAICSPANVIAGGVILCSITMPKSIPVGTNVGGKLLLNASVCLGQSITNCQSSQSVSYVGNFSAAATGSLGQTNQIPVSILLTVSPSLVSPSSQSTVVLTAHVSIFGKPARGAGVMFSMVSDSSAGTTNTIAPVYSLTDPTGSASTNLYVSSSASAGTITVSASFIGAPATNTITIP